MKLLPPDTEPNLSTCLFGLGGFLGLCLIIGSLCIFSGHGNWIWDDPTKIPSIAYAWKLLAGGIFLLGIGVASWFLWGRHEEGESGEYTYSKWD